MGILLGWIYQRRWFTLAAFVVFMGSILAGLIIHDSGRWWVWPLGGLFVATVLYERLRITGGAGQARDRIRLALPLWMGVWVTSLGMAFPYFPSQSSSLSIALLVTFCTVGAVGVFVLIVLSART